MSNYLVTDTELTSIANAIRTKGGTSGTLAFPSDFVEAIGDIPSGGGGISWDDIATLAAPSGDIVLTVNSVGNYAFAYMNPSYNWTVRGDSVTNMGQNAFRSCTNLKSAKFPSLTSCHSTGYVFNGSAQLELVDFGASNIPNNVFNGCSSLTTLILRKSTAVQTLGNVNSLASNTPFKSGGSGGTIYIPQALYSHLGDGTSLDYKAATNWSTVNGYGTITWAKIEGSAYEL